MCIYQLLTAAGDPINGQTYLDKDVALFNRNVLELERKREIFVKKIFTTRKRALKLVDCSNAYKEFIEFTKKRRSIY